MDKQANSNSFDISISPLFDFEYEYFLIFFNRISFSAKEIIHIYGTSSRVNLKSKYRYVGFGLVFWRLSRPWTNKKSSHVTCNSRLWPLLALINWSCQAQALICFSDYIHKIALVANKCLTLFYLKSVRRRWLRVSCAVLAILKPFKLNTYKWLILNRIICQTETIWRCANIW